MDSTRESLLIRARDGDGGAWEDLCAVPPIVRRLRALAEGLLDDLD
jgi:hypothetical protein